ncbi:hypothetical protein Cgig2_028046 [Carnegiea gigantea]|uniref:Uncharacterized protein n=1 Tax=Carnegiea gigantea TaxID=171969 RepID=A0A9Q1JSD3_9CARY|nr:hypothetical protein Cgig2_028046 [Carnegiea gigantea]
MWNASMVRRSAVLRKWLVDYRGALSWIDTWPFTSGPADFWGDLTDEMALYVLENFKWDQREISFHHLPLPYDYKDMCLNFNLLRLRRSPRTFFFLGYPSFTLGHAPLLVQFGLRAMLQRGGPLMSPSVRPPSKAEGVARPEECCPGDSASGTMDIASGLSAPL